MTRLEFAAVAILLAFPAGAHARTRARRVAPVDGPTAEAADADARDAAARLFPDPVEREAFYYQMASDKGLAAKVAAALKEARAAGGSDDAAVTAALKGSPQGVEWQGDAAAAVTAARNALDAGLKAKPPVSDYPETPLIAHLIASLHKQNAADLFASINRPEFGGPLPVKPEPPKTPCPPGASTALDQARVAAGGDPNAFTGEGCPKTPAGPAAPPPDARTPATARPTLSGTPPAPVSDMRPTTGVPPTPGAGTDKDKGADPTKGGSSFGFGDAARVGLMAGFGALIGTVGGPGGMIVGALIGGLVGAFLLKDGDSSAG